MSVVGGDYEELKRYNLAEIYDPAEPGLPTRAQSTKNEATT